MNLNPKPLINDTRYREKVRKFILATSNPKDIKLSTFSFLEFAVYASVRNEMGIAMDLSSNGVALLMTEYDVIANRFDAREMISYMLEKQSKVVHIETMRMMMAEGLDLFPDFYRLVTTKSIALSHEGLLAKIRQHHWIHLEDFLFALLEREDEPYFPAKVDAFHAGFAIGSISFMSFFLSTTQSQHMIGQFAEVCSNSVWFASNLCQLGNDGIAMLRLFNYFPHFRPHMIYTLCQTKHINRLILKYIFEDVEERCSFISAFNEDSVFHALADTYKKLSIEQRKEKNKEFLVIINLLLDHGANPNLHNYIAFGSKPAAYLFEDMPEGQELADALNQRSYTFWFYQPNSLVLNLLLCILFVNYCLFWYCSTSSSYATTTEFLSFLSTKLTTKFWFYYFAEGYALINLCHVQQTSVHFNLMFVFHKVRERLPDDWRFLLLGIIIACSVLILSLCLSSLCASFFSDGDYSPPMVLTSLHCLWTAYNQRIDLESEAFRNFVLTFTMCMLQTIAASAFFVYLLPTNSFVYGFLLGIALCRELFAWYEKKRKPFVDFINSFVQYTGLSTVLTMLFVKLKNEFKL